MLGALEVSPGGISFVQQLCKRLKIARGAALIIDYGSDEVPMDSLRGILNHAAVHPLHAPGRVDLSVDVDFGALRQLLEWSTTRPKLELDLSVAQAPSALLPDLLAVLPH